ncbi:MAG: hypothetical protein M1814_005592 [Vezdaea aestivalis]|nr:MAG: hypothetical protein M1814_005592 [Vezdaea aestivalis]
MFEDFTFDQPTNRRRRTQFPPSSAQQPICPHQLASPVPSLRHSSSSSSSTSTTPISPSASPYLHPHRPTPSVADLVAHLSEHSLKHTTSSLHPSAQAWPPSDSALPSPPPEAEPLHPIFPDEDEDSAARRRGYMRLVRGQRQTSGRLLAETGHVRSLERLVRDMVQAGDQCCVQERLRTPPYDEMGMLDPEDVYLAAEIEGLGLRRKRKSAPEGDIVPYTLTKSWSRYTSRPTMERAVKVTKTRRKLGERRKSEFLI